MKSICAIIVCCCGGGVVVLLMVLVVLLACSNGRGEGNERGFLFCFAMMVWLWGFVLGEIIMLGIPYLDCFLRWNIGIGAIFCFIFLDFFLVHAKNKIKENIKMPNCFLSRFLHILFMYKPKFRYFAPKIEDQRPDG